MKYNCCQQSGVCPKNKVCKPLNSQQQPWKRFTCECPTGYDGKNCDQLINSCQGYAQGSRMSGIYTILKANGLSYEVYCHFDSFGSWTLVQSYTYENGSSQAKFPEFKSPIHESQPVSKNSPTWRGYRQGKPRMKSIEYNSAFLLFTCDYEKHHDFNKSDYLRIPFKAGNNNMVDIFQLADGYTSILTYEGKIGGIQLKDCTIWLSHYNGWPLHVHISNDKTGCTLPQLASDNLTCQHGVHFHYFGGYLTNCFDKAHICVQKNNSTSQLWFGHA